MKIDSKLLLKKNILIISIVLLIAICFETFQQIFYIKRFNLYNDVAFLELFKNQIYRWIIWFFIGFILLFSIKKDVDKKINTKIILKYLGIILALVLINILFISLLSFFINSDTNSISRFFQEYFLFYLFQKSPIYILGYIAISIILFLNYSKELLEIEVQKLINVKATNRNLYEKLKKSNTDRAKVLKVKVGNNLKIIPIDKITWLEADDYCVMVHSIDLPSYSMRISLKSLENILDNHFLRVHRKSIVNMKKVKELNLNRNPNLILENNKQVLVSKSNLKKVKDYLSN
ncbi:LytR/AlgR family response regulator transcription factor [Polaribacter ponticola]|uniref:LytTR family transcriptional regulator DNA-binding domain-containing protein n=1 Tax=Polaribacter ponticola TaxID=2978475 RepID=A0ABT5S8W8_9FLAO|nr:LytTR family transcriptional regulator DNA-binding domain-containing protein [Polaribacter sp. MSW5]MDD7914269.1 LytTR family transcriptional regulator DNA-binding domain-containing protein [Polaribacter sp. MSW5]